MDLKAYYKLLSEAEEAIAERRFFDALFLSEAIFKDTNDTAVTDEIDELRTEYSHLLSQMDSLAPEKREAEANSCFRKAIDLLQMARRTWQMENPETAFGINAKPLYFVSEAEVVRQTEILANYKLGDQDYQTYLDDLFVIFYYVNFSRDVVHCLSSKIQAADSFARRTLVSALLLSILDYFSTEKLQLLLVLGEPLPKDSDEERADMQARVMTALTIIYQRYQAFFSFYTEEYAQLRAFMTAPERREQVVALMNAFTYQSLTDRVGKRVDDILPIIRNAFEKEQPHLGSSEDDEKEEKKGDKNGVRIEFKEIHLDEASNDRLFNQLASHARKVDEMRQADLDINNSSFIHMKHFKFFRIPSHWFYPFSTLVPDIQNGLTRKNGKPDRMILTIMNSNRFCASDRYSYVSMMAYLRSKGHSSISDTISEELEEMEDALNEFNDDDQDLASSVLNPYTDYAQCLYRFFYSDRSKNAFYRPFAADERTPLPLLPLFEGLFTDEKSVTPSIDSLIYLGAYERAIVLTDFATEHFGANADLLFKRGFSLMQLQQWQRALSAFQQVLLIDDDTEAELHMARCFEALAQWDSALPLLLNEEQRRSENNDKEAADIIEETGRCLIQLQRWDDAVQRFFRLEFMERRLSVVRRAIAWCSIHQGKYERAANYYRQLIEARKASWEDHLNLGHALWLQGLTTEAVRAYRESQTAFNKSKKKQRQHFRHWTEAFQEDARSLLSQQFSTVDTAMMMDRVTAPTK